MRKNIHYIYLGVSALLPILFLTATVNDALFAGLCVFAATVLMYGVSLIPNTVITESAFKIILLIAAATGVSVISLICRNVAFKGINELYVPLCTVSAVILYTGITKVKAPVTRGIFTATLGVAFTVGSTILGIVRELLGSGKFFGITVFGKNFAPFAVFTIPAGAIFIFAVILATVRHFGWEENDEL